MLLYRFSDIVANAKESIQELDDDNVNESKAFTIKATHQGLCSTFNEFNHKVRKVCTALFLYPIWMLLYISYLQI